MTDEIMNLRTILEKSSDADLLREMIALYGPAADGSWKWRERPAPPMV
jgi:hypothetical protein